MSQPPPDALEYLRSLLGEKADATRAKKSGGIIWGKPSGGEAEPGAHLLGQLDPLEGTPLAAGERVAVCERCGVAYHISTMSFIRQQNRGACVSCRTVGKFTTVLIPGGSATEAKPEQKPDPAGPVVPPEKPDPLDVSDGRIFDTAGRPIVQVHQVRDYVNREVAFEGLVLHARLTGGGAWFLHFERARSALDGFRGVIRRRDLFHWQVEDIDPGRDYQGKWLRLTGKIVDDRQWGLQMLLTAPEQVRVLDGPTLAIANSTITTAPDQTRLVSQPFERTPAREAASQPRRPSIRWRG